jgi:hypothetical protein
VYPIPQQRFEDAQYEQSLKQKETEERLLGGTKQYEKELKKNDRRAHRAYSSKKRRLCSAPRPLR